jgi:hypothetical protein
MKAMPSEDELSAQKREILLSMWKARAIGNRAISLRDLRARLSDEAKRDFVSHMKSLEARLFVQIIHRNEQDAVSLTPIGLACVRQIQDGSLDIVAGPR